MGKYEGEEVNAKVGKDVAHPPVGVHGAVDDLSWNARQQKGGSQHGGLGLLFYLVEKLAVIFLFYLTDDRKNLFLSNVCSSENT